MIKKDYLTGMLFFFIVCCLPAWSETNNTASTIFDFESGDLNGWSNINIGGGITITQEDKHTGSYSVKLIADSESKEYWSVQLETPQISVIPTHLYKISFWAKAVGGDGIIRLSTATSNQLKAEFSDEDRQYLPDLNIASGWTKYTYEVVYSSGLEAAGSILQLRFDAGKNANVTYYIDDVLIEDLTPDAETIGTIPLAKDHKKFLGNIIPNNVPDGFDLYWNQITPENSGKWTSVEWGRNSMNWTALDRAYNHAKNNGYKFKYHTFVWGNQEPSWITSLSAAEQKAEMEEFMKAVASRYSDIDYIDVVNEALHAPSSIREALGGDGTTGWDWVVWSFQKAREYFPNAKLHINDYGIINDIDKARRYIEIIDILKQQNLIDGIGIQCHEFNINWVSVSTMNTVLDLLGETDLPIHVSELDISGNPAGNEDSQYQLYKEKFPVLWEHESVIGITLWGYITGATWKEGTGIVEQNGTERKAMTWLKNYMASDASKVENKFETITGNKSLDITNDIEIYPNPVTSYLVIKGKNIKKAGIYTISGQCLLSWENPEVIDVEWLEKGMYLLNIETENNTITRKIFKK